MAKIYNDLLSINIQQQLYLNNNTQYQAYQNRKQQINTFKQYSYRKSENPALMNRTDNKQQFPLTKSFIQQLTKMLKTKLRIDDYINNLSCMLSQKKVYTHQIFQNKQAYLKQTQNSAKESKSRCRVDRRILYQYIQKQYNIVRLLKLAILVQRCIINGNVSDCLEIVDCVMEQVQLVKNRNRQICIRKYIDGQLYQDNSFQNFMISNIIQPYLVYLQKRSSYNISHVNYKQNDDNSIQNILEQIYTKLNLINKLSQITKHIMTISRYYGPYYGFIVDFNVQIGVDVSQIYQKLVSDIKSIEYYLISINDTHYNNNNNSINKINQVLSKIQTMLQQLDKTNQSLYIIYYNYYNYRSLIHYIPNFVNTDRILNKIIKIKKNINVMMKQWQRKQRVCAILDKIRSKQMNRSQYCGDRNRSLSQSCVRNRGNRVNVGNSGNIGNYNGLVHSVIYSKGSTGWYNRSNSINFKSNDQVTIDPQDIDKQDSNKQNIHIRQKQARQQMTASTSTYHSDSNSTCWNKQPKKLEQNDDEGSIDEKQMDSMQLYLQMNLVLDNIQQIQRHKLHQSIIINM